MKSRYIFVLHIIFEAVGLFTLADDTCFASLGASENGTLPNTAFLASSENDLSHRALHGRLGNAPRSWIPKNFQPVTDLYDEFLQINLGQLFTVNGVATQGFTSGIFFVKTYFLKFSSDGEIFDDYLQSKVLKIFDGNMDSSSIVVQKLPCSVVSKYIQFVPLDFANGIALKVDVFGCVFIEKKGNQIEDFKAGYATANGVEISWLQNSNDVEFFFITYYPIGDSSSSVKYPVYLQNAKGVDKKKYIHNLSGLISCSDYRIRLSVYNKIGCGIPQVYSITTTTLVSRPIPPQKVEYDILQPETIFLRWQKSRIGYNCAQLITGFKIEYRLHQSSSKYSLVTIPATFSSYNLTGLQGWQKYDIRILSVGTQGESDYVMYTISVEGKAPDQQPIITTLISEEPRTILVKWQNPPVDKVNGFSVYFRIKNEPQLDWEFIGLPSTATSIRISPTAKMLEAWKVYQVYISLYNIRHKLDSNVEEVLVKGIAPGLAPANLLADIVLETKISLRWDPVPAEYLPEIFQGYQLFFAEGDETFVKAHVYPSMETQRVMQNLKPGLVYRFVVAAVSNNLPGPLSEVLKVRTDLGQLSAPKIDVASSNQANTIFVEWSLSENNIVSSITVSYKPLSSSIWLSKVVLQGKNTIIVQLESWIEYEIKVELDSLGRKATSDVKKVLVIGEAPGMAPKNLYATTVEESAIGLVWDNVEPVYIPNIFQGYQVWAAMDNESFHSASKTIMETQYIVRSLNPATTYKFKVTAVSNNQFGPFSEVLSISTLPVKTPTSPVITNIEEKSGKIKIFWESRFNSRVPITLFIIVLRDRAGLQENITIYHSNQLHANDLRSFSRTVSVPSFTSFAIIIKSCILDTCSPFSDEFFFTTMEDPPSTVLNLNVKVSLDNTYVSWEPPSYVKGILRKYMVEVINPLTNKIIYTDITDNSTNSIKYHNLPFYTELCVRVKAITSLDGPSVNTTFTSPQGVPSAPLEVKAILLKDDQASVTWKPPQSPNGVITMYKVVYEGTKYYSLSFNHKNHVEANRTDEVVRIKNLHPGTSYKIQVFASTIKGYGEGSAPREVRTPVKAPLPPPIPTAYPNEISSNSIIVHLQPSSDLNGPISTYQVIIEEVGNSLSNRVERKRRSTLPSTLYDYNTAKKLGHKIYITAEINENQVPSKFEVGDGVIYNNYLNAPLQPKSSYLLHVRGKTVLPEEILYGSVSTLVLPPTRDAQYGERPKIVFSVPLIIIICLALLIIIIAIVFIRYSRRRKRKNYKDSVQISFVPIQRQGSENKDGIASTSDYAIHPDHPPIEITLFPKAVAKLHKNDNIGFKEEYKQLKIGREFAWDVAHLPENKPKNRYANIVAYDHSRVILSKVENELGSDYINASYMDGYKKANSVIATQGPLPNTFNDFWRMVWEVHSLCIVMLTNLREKNKLKCHKYWPDASFEYGEVLVTLLGEESFADFTIRSFKIQHKQSQESREVKQFHLTSWPEHGVPNHPTTLLAFRKKVLSYEKPKSGPTIVHCSAGVGRTGAYIVLDAMLDRIKEEGTVDVFNFIAALRMRRIAMVQTEDQYIFVHDAIAEVILSGNTEVTLSGLKNAIKKLNQVDSDSKVSGFEKQWKILNHANPVLPNSEMATALQNNSKNRFSTVLPTDSNRVLLLPIDENELTTYINAVYVDSYKQKNAYILTQCPLPKTVLDFWRMVSEHGSSTIVMLNTLDEGDDYATFWPESGVKEYGMITVECLDTSKKDDISLNGFLKPAYSIPPAELNVRNFKVTDVRQPNSSLTVKLLQYTGWTETRVPSNYKTMIGFLVLVQKWIQQSLDSPIIILCSDGIGRSGTLAAIMYTLERLKIEHIIDVFQAVKRMRMQRPHLVKYMDQYKYIHLIVQEYVNAFEDRAK